MRAETPQEKRVADQTIRHPFFVGRPKWFYRAGAATPPTDAGSIFDTQAGVIEPTVEPERPAVARIDLPV